MSSLDLTTLRHTALLARIKLNSTEEEKFLPQLASVLDYVEILNQVDTSGVPPSFQAVSQKLTGRLDTVVSGLSQKQALASAPDSQDGYFKVKASIKK
jgi:aspartyl-tRNA(Asn)/glutamyl-tRNA(Gln) amidotransferase subunit C